jgi:ATP-dependent Lon protease
MVLTRNQKRKYTLDDGEQNLEVDDSFTTVNLTKKRKVEHSDGSSDSDSEDSLTTAPTTVESDISESFNEERDESLEDDTLDDRFNPNTTNKTKGVVSLKISQQHIQQIIKESVRQLIKRADGDGEDFLNMDADKEAEDDYEKFLEYVNSIYEGDFFQRVPIEERKKALKSQFSKEQIQKMNQDLENIKRTYTNGAPNIVDILQLDINTAQKQKMLEKMHHYVNSDILSPEYNNTLKFLETNIKKYDDPKLEQVEKEILKATMSAEYADSYKKRVLKSCMPMHNKVIAYKKLEIMETYEDSDSSEYSKYKNWMDTLISVPFGQYIETPSLANEDTPQFVKRVRMVLDDKLSFLEQPKDQILNIVTQMIRNPNTSLNALGIYGPRGLGKTSIVKSIAEALGRPYRTISLGGESDASLLTGHGFTYVGSMPGRLIDILRETKCMNPIIMFDELDKVSQTHHGKEIIGNLIHLTDTTTNHKYNYDRYFSGVEFDLSKVLFIFTYNDPSKVDKILADRLFKIKVNNYSFAEKLEITKKHLINNVLEQYHFSTKDISFTEDCIQYIVKTSQSDEGMRDIKRKVELIVSRINTLLLTNPNDNIVKLKYRSLYESYKTLPTIVQKEHVDTLLSESFSTDNDETPPPFGMYN